MVFRTTKSFYTYRKASVIQKIMEKNKISNSLVSIIEKERLETAASILDFDFKKKRVRILSEAQNVKQGSNGIMYWMFREMRVQDNWSLLFAQKLALKNKIPLYVFFFLVPSFLEASLRHYKFLLIG